MENSHLSQHPSFPQQYIVICTLCSPFFFGRQVSVFELSIIRPRLSHSYQFEAWCFNSFCVSKLEQPTGCICSKLNSIRSTDIFSRYSGLQLNPTNLCFNITTTGPVVAQSSAAVTNITEDSIYRTGYISKLYTMYFGHG